jgi:hypothetical protein
MVSRFEHLHTADVPGDVALEDGLSVRSLCCCLVAGNLAAQ